MAKCSLGKVKGSSMQVSGRILSQLRGDLCILCWEAPHGLHGICLLAGLRDSSFCLPYCQAPFWSSLFVVMSSSRQTKNSRSVDLFSDPSLFPVSCGAEASSDLLSFLWRSQRVHRQLHLFLRRICLTQPSLALLSMQ